MGRTCVLYDVIEPLDYVERAPVPGLMLCETVYLAFFELMEARMFCRSPQWLFVAVLHGNSSSLVYLSGSLTGSHPAGVFWIDITHVWEGARTPLEGWGDLQKLLPFAFSSSSWNKKKINPHIFLKFFSSLLLTSLHISNMIIILWATNLSIAHFVFLNASSDLRSLKDAKNKNSAQFVN